MLESEPHCVFKSMIITGLLLADDLYNHLAIRARKLKVRINLLLAQALEYEAQLRKFPMTAFDVINSRIQAFSNSRFHRQAALTGH